MAAAVMYLFSNNKKKNSLSSHIHIKFLWAGPIFMFWACTASNSIWKIIIISNNCVKDCCSMNWHNGLLQMSVNTFPVPNTGFLPLRENTPQLLVTITDLTPQGIFLCEILFEEWITPFLAQYYQSRLQPSRGCSLPGQAAHYEIHLPLTHTCINI